MLVSSGHHYNAMHMKLQSHLICIGLSLLISWSCNPSNLSSALDQGTQSVSLQISHRTEWRTLWIEGKTDLPDGAYVNIRIIHELGQTTPMDTWPASNLMDNARSTVKDGTFWTKINTIRWPAGSVTVSAQFPSPPQAPEITKRYGEFGEHMAGMNVISQNGMKAVNVEEIFNFRP